MSGIVYTSKYQNLHMDRAVADSMKTVNITINTNLPFSSSAVLLYRYAHPYSYTPQFWGLWDIRMGPNVGAIANQVRRGYGGINVSTAIATRAKFFYTVDETHISLYLIYDGLSTPPNIAGTTATFTGYLFANDRTNQVYGQA